MGVISDLLKEIKINKEKEVEEKKKKLMKR